MIELTPIGTVHSPLTDPAGAPRQGDEGAPEARLVFVAGVLDALRDIEPGDRLILLTWLHRARRDVRPQEAVDGTPILDVKSVLGPAR
jgi:tRNA (Thr-GGU) A37 N-methylase